MSTADIFKKRLRQAVKESTLTVAEYAQDNHRFKSRTGALEQSVMTDYRAGGLTGVITLDLNRAFAPKIKRLCGGHRVVDLLSLKASATPDLPGILLFLTL